MAGDPRRAALYHEERRRLSAAVSRVALALGLVAYLAVTLLAIAEYGLTGVLPWLRLVPLIAAAIAALVGLLSTGREIRELTVPLAIAGCGIVLAVAPVFESGPVPGAPGHTAAVVVAIGYGYAFGGVSVLRSSIVALAVSTSFLLGVLSSSPDTDWIMALKLIVPHLAGHLGGIAGRLALGRISRDTYTEKASLAESARSMEEQAEELRKEADSHSRRASRATGALAFLSAHDALTGLRNRNALQASMAELIESSSPFALLMLDIDRFKTLNDNLGHRRGDEVLRQIAKRVQDTVRNGDIVARQGGDEFVVIVTSARDSAALTAVVDRVLEAIRRPISIPGHIVNATGSAGIALFPNDAEEEDTLVRCADTALYNAKAAGRDRASFFTASVGATSTQRARLERWLKEATARQEFTLSYQPKVAISTGHVVGVEALIRWNSPAGPMSPGAFIPVAEEIGLMRQIGSWVLHTAIAEISPLCREITSEFKLSINLSADQLADNELLEDIERSAAAAGMTPSHLRFELVESSVMSDVEQAQRLMHRIRELGSTLSIDDFGTGYSSLAYLSRFPIDELKIDRAFVSNMTRNKEDEAIVRTIILLGHSLRLQIVAEGVETSQDVAMLDEMGCDVSQGYYHARPLPASELPFTIVDGVPRLVDRALG